MMVIVQNEKFIAELNRSFGMYISDEEAKELLEYIDADGSGKFKMIDSSGEISLEEFQGKINYIDYSQRIHEWSPMTLISK